MRVAMSGAGNMGGQIMAALEAADDIELVGALDGLASASSVEIAGREVPLSSSLDALADWSADAVIDFSNAAWTERLLPRLIEAGVHPVIGTSGLSDELVADSAAACAGRGLGGVIAPNFALGAVMMMHLARIAAGRFDSVEVLEMHHAGKVDAPSGTAVATAQELREARGRDFERNVAEREPIPGGRGAEHGGVALHSVRLPGLVAHQQIMFGGVGETLTIRHDSMSRESFVPMVLHATRSVIKLDRLVVGLDRLLGLRD